MPDALLAESLLDIRGLRSGYGAVEVLRGIDCEIRPGEIVALLGSNGAGKSTLNNTVCGLLPASAGRVVFDGEDFTRARTTRVVASQPEPTASRHGIDSPARIGTSRSSPNGRSAGTVHDNRSSVMRS